MAKEISIIRQEAQQVQNVTQVGENTAQRVGGVLVDIVDKAEEYETDIDNLNANTGVSDYEDFSTSKAYSVGDVVKYNGLLYEFTTDHEAGEWNSGEVTETSLKIKLQESFNISGNSQINISVSNQTAFDIKYKTFSFTFYYSIKDIVAELLTLRLSYSDGSSDDYIQIPEPNESKFFTHESEKEINRIRLYYAGGYVTQAGSINYIFFKNAADTEIIKSFQKADETINNSLENITKTINEELYNIIENHDINISSSNQNIFRQSFAPAINNAIIRLEIDGIETYDGRLSLALRNQSGSNTYKYLDNKSQIVELTFDEAISEIRIYYAGNSVTKAGNVIVTYYKGIRKELVKVEKKLSDKIEILEDTINENDSNAKFDISNLKERVIDEQIKNDFRWKEFDGLYLTMTFDDSNTDISDLQDLAEELSVPFCYATIPSKLDAICNSEEKVREVLLRAQNNGGEIMSHSSRPLTSSSTIEDYDDVYIKTKKQLIDAGFKVNGIITTGGTGYNTQNFDLSTEIGRIYYQYGDLTAQNNQNIEQFYNPRTFTDNGLEAVKSHIDEQIISGKCWIRLASHGTNNPNTSTVDVFRQIMQYAKSKGINIVTWKYMYDKFKGSVFEKEIDLLKSKS